MSDTIRWGILGTGRIAKQFARGLKTAKGAELKAVGSRTQQAADAFGDAFQVPRRHAGYDALANDDEVDAIYVATPHSCHKENSVLCLKAGKAVLCEKPLAINAAQAQEMVDVARAENRFLMEAMWTRFIPLIVKAREMIEDGAIGEVRMLSADFGFRAGWDPKNRLLDPEFGGGALLDVGVYNVSLASMILGPPVGVATLAHLGETGVDEQAAMVLSYDEGRLAILYTAVRTTTPHEAVIMGTEGWIRIHAPYWKATKMTLWRSREDEELIEIPFEGNGYNYEAEEVMTCLREGRLESDGMTLDESLAIMHTMDRIRAEWGLKYPME